MIIQSTTKIVILFLIANIWISTFLLFTNPRNWFRNLAAPFLTILQLFRATIAVNVWISAYTLFFLSTVLTALFIPLLKKLRTRRQITTWRKARIWSVLRMIFPSEVNISDDVKRLLATGRTIVVAHPHGFVPIGVIMHFLAYDRRLPYQFAVAIHSALFYSILTGGILQRLGAIEATRSAIEAAISRGENVIICGGGVQEMCRSGSNALFLDHRGYIRIAKNMKSAILLCYSGGEETLFPAISTSFLRLRSRFSSLTRFPIRFPAHRIGISTRFRLQFRSLTAENVSRTNLDMLHEIIKKKLTKMQKNS